MSNFLELISLFMLLSREFSQAVPFHSSDKMDKICSSRTMRILELVSREPIEDVEDIPESHECLEADDVVELADEEEDEVEGDDSQDEEDGDFSADYGEMFISKDETFWLKTSFTRRRQRSSNIIRIPPGVSSSVDKEGNVAYFFKLFISPAIVDIVVKYTNQRGSWETEEYNKKHEGVQRKWINVDETEIYAFIGLLICSGATKSNREPVTMLWSSGFLFQRPIYAATMSRTRFTTICSYLRFDDKTSRERRVSSDKLAPIREINDLFVSYCQKYYNPGTHLTVDERLVPFRGHAPFRVYMKSKPAKYGLKIWVLADSNTAYCKNLQVYTGKENGKPEKNQGKRVVHDLVGILGKGYGITTDNFFTSLELAEELLDKNLTLCGTLRKNKTFIPKEFLPAKNRTLYSSLFGFQPEITLVSHVTHANKCVVLLSSEHYSEKFDENAQKKTPEIISHYNNTKGGVDTLDRMAGEYTCQRMTRRWPMALFMNMIDLAGVNSFILWKDVHPEWHKGNESRRRLFLLELSKQLVEPLISRRLHEQSFQKSQPTARQEVASKCLKTITEEHENTTPSTPSTSNEGRNEPHTSTSTRGKKRARCFLCERRTDKKVATFCALCKNFVCKEHRKDTPICLNCK